MRVASYRETMQHRTRHPAATAPRGEPAGRQRGGYAYGLKSALTGGWPDFFGSPNGSRLGLFLRGFQPLALFDEFLPLVPHLFGRQLVNWTFRVFYGLGAISPGSFRKGQNGKNSSAGGLHSWFRRASMGLFWCKQDGPAST